MAYTSEVDPKFIFKMFSKNITEKQTIRYLQILERLGNSKFEQNLVADKRILQFIRETTKESRKEGFQKNIYINEEIKWHYAINVWCFHQYIQCVKWNAYQKNSEDGLIGYDLKRPKAQLYGYNFNAFQFLQISLLIFCFVWNHSTCMSIL